MEGSGALGRPLPRDRFGGSFLGSILKPCRNQEEQAATAIQCQKIFTRDVIQDPKWLRDITGLEKAIRGSWPRAEHCVTALKGGLVRTLQCWRLQLLRPSTHGFASRATPPHFRLKIKYTIKRVSKPRNTLYRTPQKSRTYRQDGACRGGINEASGEQNEVKGTSTFTVVLSGSESCHLSSCELIKLTGERSAKSNAATRTGSNATQCRKVI